MSVYHSMEAGSVPGMRDRATGPKTIYNFGLSGGTSRALNATEAQAEVGRITDLMDEALEAVREGYSRQFLEFMRERLEGFDLRNHIVVIQASMGTSGLVIVDRRTMKCTRAYNLRARGAVVGRLQEIDQFLEGSWEWSSHLDKQLLNHFTKGPKS
jgi:hypothetical protein